MLLFLFVYLTAAVEEEANVTCPSVCMSLSPSSICKSKQTPGFNFTILTTKHVFHNQSTSSPKYFSEDRYSGLDYWLFAHQLIDYHLNNLSHKNGRKCCFLPLKYGNFLVFLVHYHINQNIFRRLEWQNKIFEDITSDFKKLGCTFFTIFWHSFML